MGLERCINATVTRIMARGLLIFDRYGEERLSCYIFLVKTVRGSSNMP